MVTEYQQCYETALKDTKSDFEAARNRLETERGEQDRRLQADLSAYMESERLYAEEEEILTRDTADYQYKNRVGGSQWSLRLGIALVLLVGLGLAAIWFFVLS